MKAIQMFKTIMGDAPDYLRSSFTFASDIHARLLRSSSNFQLYTPNLIMKYTEIHCIFRFIRLEFPSFIYSWLKPCIYVG